MGRNGRNDLRPRLAKGDMHRWAKATGLAYSQVHSYITGKVTPGLRNAVALARVSGGKLRVEDFLAELEPAPDGEGGEGEHEAA